MGVGECGELGFLQKPRQNMLGLELDFEYSEKGNAVWEHYKQESDMIRFKTSNLLIVMYKTKLN